MLPAAVSRRRVNGDQAIDLAAAEQAVGDLLVALGRDPKSEHLAETPSRVASAFAEMLTAEPFDLTTFPNDERYDELVLARDIPFQSLCEHHLLPFQPKQRRQARAEPPARLRRRRTRSRLCTPRPGSLAPPDARSRPFAAQALLDQACQVLSPEQRPAADLDAR